MSRKFFNYIGFEEVWYSEELCVFNVGDFSFYLQNFYNKDWAENSMMFVEMDQLEKWRNSLIQKDLPGQFDNVRIGQIRIENWGKEFMMHDPSGVLWHFGSFTERDE